MQTMKSVSQKTEPNQDIIKLMEAFKKMVNHCIRIGLKYDVCIVKKLSPLSYYELQNYDVMSSYKLCAISQACGRLSQMKRDIRNGKEVSSPFIRKPFITNCYNFKINGNLISIPFKPRQPINLLLNHHTTKLLSDKNLKIHSFTLTPKQINITVSRQVKQIYCTNVIGIDRNLRNVTVGNHESVTFYKTNKLLSIKQNTIHARAGFKRNDRRKKGVWYKKMQQRLQKRTKQFLHRLSKDIVTNAEKNKSAIALEDLKGIRKLYKKGNGQGNKYRGKLNGWQFYELQRQIEYKAAWAGVPVSFVDPRRTSKQCPICGDRIQEDMQNRRKLLCTNCGKSMDRDVVASMNIAHKAWARFTHARGDTGEAQSSVFDEPMTEPTASDYGDVVIRIVDVSKSTLSGGSRRVGRTL